MPYLDPEKQREAQRASYARRREKREFREAEKARCARWYQENRERHIENVIKNREARSLGI